MGWPEGVTDITSIRGVLNINIGTLNRRSIEGMFIAGAKAICDSRAPEHEDSCSMCGKFCAVRSMNKALNGKYIDIL